MTTREKAKGLVNMIYQPMSLLSPNMNSQQNWEWAKLRALEVVEEIKSALHITTGHCELRLLDMHEVNKDLQYWDEIIIEIKKL